MAEVVTDAPSSLFNQLFIGDGSVLALIIAAIAAIIAFLDYRRSDFSSRRLEQAIGPLFDLVEPTMMRDAAFPPSPAVVQKAVDMLSGQLLLCGGKLRPYRTLKPDSPSLASDWSAFCMQVSREYDWLSRWNNLPRRSILYRAQCYKARFAVLPIALYLLRSLFALAVFSVSILAGVAAVQSVLNGELEKVVPCLALCFSFLLFTWAACR